MNKVSASVNTPVLTVVVPSAISMMTGPLKTPQNYSTHCRDPEKGQQTLGNPKTYISSYKSLYNPYYSPKKGTPNLGNPHPHYPATLTLNPKP